MRRGEIWVVGGGVYASKPRPALVIQDDLYDSDSLTVIPLTTQHVEAPLYRVSVGATETTGLRTDSQVMIDKITTVKRSHVTDHVGRLPAGDLLTVERLLLALLGLAR